MKRMLTHRKRPSLSKKGLKTHKRFFRTIKSQQKSNIQIESPYNSSQFLIENSSSPFYDENEDDIDQDFIPNPLYQIKETEDLFDEDSISLRKFASSATRGESFNLDTHANIENSCLF